jgi:hypothetical protein
MLTSGDVIPVVGAMRDQDVIRRADGVVAPVPTGERRWSTPEMLAVEERLVASALRRQEAGVGVVLAGVLDETLRAGLERLPSLGADQIEMAARLARSGAGVECVEAAPRNRQDHRPGRVRRSLPQGGHPGDRLRTQRARQRRAAPGSADRSLPHGGQAPGGPGQGGPDARLGRDPR